MPSRTTFHSFLSDLRLTSLLESKENNEYSSRSFPRIYINSTYKSWLDISMDTTNPLIAELAKTLAEKTTSGVSTYKTQSLLSFFFFTGQSRVSPFINPHPHPHPHPRYWPIHLLRRLKADWNREDPQVTEAPGLLLRHFGVREAEHLKFNPVKFRNFMKY